MPEPTTIDELTAEFDKMRAAVGRGIQAGIRTRSAHRRSRRQATQKMSPEVRALVADVVKAAHAEYRREQYPSHLRRIAQEMRDNGRITDTDKQLGQAQHRAEQAQDRARQAEGQAAAAEQRRDRQRSATMGGVSDDTVMMSLPALVVAEAATDIVLDELPELDAVAAATPDDGLGPADGPVWEPEPDIEALALADPEADLGWDPPAEPPIDLDLETSPAPEPDAGDTFDLSRVLNAVSAQTGVSLADQLAHGAEASTQIAVLPPSADLGVDLDLGPEI